MEREPRFSCFWCYPFLNVIQINVAMSTHLDRLLFAQGNRCFFCRKELPKTEASVEHLVASANGGASDDGNCVACCKALNHLLGSKSIKEKLQIVLNQRGNFQCPGNTNGAQPTSASSSNQPMPQKTAVASGSSIDLVLADLRKRGASRPRKLSTLTSTIKALLKQQQRPNSDGELKTLVAELQRLGKVVITDTKVSYKLG